jgi:hypothetical protein
MPSQVITEVEIKNAPWAATPTIHLNSGLVAVIGARGSGKTALADVIAAGCDAISLSSWNADENISPSFLVRARHNGGDPRRRAVALFDSETGRTWTHFGGYPSNSF